MGFPGDPVNKHMPANGGEMSLIPGPGRFHMLQGNTAHVFTTASEGPML